MFDYTQQVISHKRDTEIDSLDVLFVNAHIILDMISELTEYAIVLRNAETKGAINGKLKRMAQEGIITLESLKLNHSDKSI